ncbi:O-antigen ligase family protein [Consotaella aegiceratis]|uniref:O-antigen ligase family protein n=1 Tax=Consotaella aegiceratis TaxID=3097961 RepID=UPI002F3E3143
MLEWSHRILGVLFILVLLFGVLPLGSVDSINLYASVLLQAALFAIAVCLPMREPIQRSVLRPVLTVVLACAAWLTVQAVSFEGNPLANPIWSAVAEPLDLVGGSISVAPGETIRSLPSLLGPFLVFATAAVLASRDDRPERLWNRLAYLGFALVAFGLLRYALFPDVRLFSQIHLNAGAVTSVLVNRNNAATLFGLTSLALCGTFFVHLARLDWFRLRRDVREFHPGILRRYSALLLALAALFVTLLALFLTKSRAGFGATLLALLLAIGTATATLPSRRIAKRPRWIIVTLAALVLGIFTVFGQQTIHRAQMVGFEDARSCIYRDVMRAIADYPWVGTGFGTFEAIFPMYRSAECGIVGVWSRAHNSWLEGALGLGLPFFVLLVGYCLFRLIRIYRVGIRERRRYRAIPIASLAMLLLVGVHSVFDFSLQIHGVAIYFAGLLGAGTAVSLARHGNDGV